MKTEETHFNELQQKTRAIASTWILAGFGAIAYFIKTSAPAHEYFSAYTLINLICLMVVVGLLILWVIDQMVYQQLLNANFVSGLFHEFKNADTPPIRTLMVVASGYGGMGRCYNLFYFIPMTAFTVFSTAAMVLELSSSQPGQTAKVQVTSLVIAAVLIALYILIWSFVFSNKRSIPYYNLLKSFGDSEFEKIASPAACARVIRAWKAEARQPDESAS